MQTLQHLVYCFEDKENVHTSHNVYQVEVDVFGEKLSQSEMKQKAKEAQVMAAEAEFNRLNRRVQELEEDLENTETKFVLGSQKLDKAATTADDSDRMKKVLENRAADDEKKLVRLAEELKEAQKQAEDADKMYDETQKKMMETERNLEVSDERASVGEFKIIELEEELKVVANNLRSLEVSEDKANKRESHYKEEIKRLTVKLKQSETRSEFAERSVLKLQKEVKVFRVLESMEVCTQTITFQVDRLEDELLGEQEKFKAITEELDQTFAEMSGY